MTAINKFNKSLLYTIRSPHTDKYYIGSTAQILCKRFSDHIRHYRRYLNGKTNFTTSFKILELGDAYIELLEEINCDNRNQLEKREGELIREHKINCVNRNIPCRTGKEYYNDNSDIIKEHRKEYYNDNSDIIKEHRKEYYNDNFDRISQQKKEYNLINADKLKEYYKEYNLLNADKKKQYMKEYNLLNADKINEKRRAKNAEKKLLNNLATITI